MHGTGGERGTIVALEEVGYRYPLAETRPRTALECVSLRIREGERLAVLGAAGSGKTTLACLLAGLCDPSTGRIDRRRDLASGSDLRLPVGMVGQNPEDTFTSPVVREEMGMVLQNLAWDDRRIDDAVGGMLAEIGLEDYAGSAPALLSGGQKQILALASILIAEPRLLILDEPLSLLDSRGRDGFSALLSKWARGGEGALVYLSSEVEDARRGERVAVLAGGRLVWSGRRNALPLDGPSLQGWGLRPPETTELASLLLPEGSPRRAALWQPGQLAEYLCRYE